MRFTDEADLVETLSCEDEVGGLSKDHCDEAASTMSEKDGPVSSDSFGAWPAFRLQKRSPSRSGAASAAAKIMQRMKKRMVKMYNNIEL